MSDEANDWVEVGCVARPHGIRGELRVKLHNPDSEVLLNAAEVLVRSEGQAERVMPIRSARPAADGITLLAFDGVHDRTSAEALRNATLLVPRSSLPDADDDEFYVHDILDAKVIGEDGTYFGRVVDYLSYPAVDVLVVKGDKRYEVPVIEDFVRRMDVEAKEIVVAPIDDFETS